MTSAEEGLRRRYHLWVAGLLLLIAVGDLAVIAYRKWVPASLSVQSFTPVSAQTRMDPNTAGINDLECIPGMRRNVARAIVRYREGFRTRFPGRPAFRNLQDLKGVRGISDKTLLRLEPFLVFPGSVVTTAPASRSDAVDGGKGRQPAISNPPGTVSSGKK